MSDGVFMKFDGSGLNAGLDALAAGSAAQVRPAAQAASQVLYDEVLLRTPVGKKAHKTKSGRVVQPGALKAAMYQAFSKDNSPPGTAEYHISWNSRKAPHGHLVEGGTSHSAAVPFLRSSYDAKADAALQAANDRWVDGTEKVLRSLE